MPSRSSGIILAHSNEAEWQSFKHNKNNEAFIDRICVIKVPYCLRVTEEQKIYDKLIRNSELADAPCAAATLEMLARFAVLSRLRLHPNSNLFSKLRVYNGENLRETEPNVKTMQEYRDTAGVDEGMEGISTRFAFKVLSATFNHDTREVGADPVHLMYVLEQHIKREQFGEDIEKQYLEFIKGVLAPRYAEFIGNEIQKAYLESYNDYGQNLFDRYLDYADAWIENLDFKDPDTGQMLDREQLNQELTKIEKPAGIANPKDFRNEVVKFALRARAQHEGKNPSWTSYEKIREVIERRMFSQVEDLLPVISFGTKKEVETETQTFRISGAHDGARLYRATGPAPRRMVYARETSGIETGRQMSTEMNIIDRRLNPQGKSLSNRRRFIRRAKQELVEAVHKATSERSISDLGGEEKVWVKTSRLKEPQIRHSSALGQRDYVFPGNKQYEEGDRLKRSSSQAGGAAGRPRLMAKARTGFSSC